MELLFVGLLLLFVGLKLTRHVDWSWGWVLLPAWGPLLLFFVVGLVLGAASV